jgi:hypothetical protein
VFSLDDKLYLLKGDEAEVVLMASNTRNMFWHSIEVEEKLFVHEYGQTPCAIYSSKDFESWEKIITNFGIDKQSKHFHDIGFDPYRKWLITTSGDGCLTRIAVSEDLGSSWRPFYKSPWQFVPVLVDCDRWLLGLDSGIAKGGVSVYDVERDEWSFTFLRSPICKRAQFTALKRFGDYYFSGLG